MLGASGRLGLHPRRIGCVGHTCPSPSHLLSSGGSKGYKCVGNGQNYLVRHKVLLRGKSHVIQAAAAQPEPQPQNNSNQLQPVSFTFDKPADASSNSAEGSKSSSSGTSEGKTLLASTNSTSATGTSKDASIPSDGSSSSASSAAGEQAASSTAHLPAWLQGAQSHPVLSRIMMFFAWITSMLQGLPLWVQNQQLAKLREAADEDPRNAERHAAYLAELNRAGRHREVMARVEGREHATGSAVVVEYLRALIASGKVSEYTGASAPGAVHSAASTVGAVAGAATLPVQASSMDSHRSLSQLLKDLQAQVAGEQPDDEPGASVRRPLHVLMHGGSPATAPKPTGPLQVVWSLISTMLVIVALAFVWLLGSQVVRRVQQQGQATTATAASSAAVGSLGSGGSPAVEPKEYKKEELPEKSIRTFKDVKGCDEAKEELKEVVEFLKNPAKFTRLGAKLPKGVLLTGPPGTGKTLIARAVAGEAGVPFFYRAGSEFEELYVGVGSRRMRALFQAAKKKSPCIVFIDEIDAIGGNRKHWENHTRKTLNQLLVEMDGFESNDGVIVMAATNLPETLDPALKRPGRFDRQVAVPLPDIKGRMELLEFYLHDKPISPDVDRDLLARQTQGFSGADISNLVNEAALLAAKEGADLVTPAMLDTSFDKIRMGVERKSVKRTLEGRKRTAYHEGGHAIVATFTAGASPIHKATIVPRGHALGMVTQVGREDEFSINRQQMLARIMVCMGGQVAEELIFGEDQVTSGATDDLRQATDWARHMVTQCGMNAEVGPLYVADEKHLSEALKQVIDGQVRQMLVEARTSVKALLTEKIKELHALADALMEYETLTQAEIEAVLRGELPRPQLPPASPPPEGPSGGDRQREEGGEQLEPAATSTAAVTGAEASQSTEATSEPGVAAGHAVGWPRE